METHRDYKVIFRSAESGFAFSSCSFAFSSTGLPVFSVVIVPVITMEYSCLIFLKNKAKQRTFLMTAIFASVL